ncbi:MAG: hypothetical protein WC708_11525, partial [Lentisphaeria bacterium]
QTWEARVDLEVEMFALPAGDRVFQRRLSRHYYKTVRYVKEKHMINNMLDFLRHQALPELIAEMFYLDAVAAPQPDADGKTPPPAPATPAEPRVPPADALDAVG